MMKEEISHVRLKVHGRVQGVFYRQSTRDKARVLGLTGWVRNEDDGTVVVEAFGHRSRLESLIAWCHEGPPSAKVSSVEIQWLENADSPDGFHVH